MRPDGEDYFDNDDLSEKLEEAVGVAINQAMTEIGGSFVIKWVAAVEVMTPDGERGVWSFTSPDATRWDIFGLLHELEHFQVATMTAEIIRRDNHG